jgi:hypothetical protein
MSVHERLLDTTRSPEEAVPRENLDDKGFETRVEMWRNYLADAVDGPKLDVEELSDYIIIRGVSVVSEDEFELSIPIENDIDTAYGIAKDCVLERIDFYPKSSGEQVRVRYHVRKLPEGKENDSFATDNKTRNSIMVTYDIQTDGKKNVCLNQDKFGYTNEGSPRMIPLYIHN